MKIENDKSMIEKLEIITEIIKMIDEETRLRISHLNDEDQIHVLINILLNITLSFFKNNSKKKFIKQNIDDFCYQLKYHFEINNIH